MTIALAIIGAGAHARDQHAPAIAAWSAAHPGAVRVAVVCDRRQEAASALAAGFGAAVVTSWQEALAMPGLDAVLVCTPPALTPEVALAAAGRGLALWLEKPLGATLADAERLAVGLGGRHLVSMNRRFDLAFAAAARLLAPRRIGRLEMRFARRGRREPDFLASTGIHAIDLLQHLAGGLRLASVASEAVDGTHRHQLHLAGERCPDIRLGIDPQADANAERIVAHGDGWRLEAASAWFDAGHVRLHGSGWDGPGLEVDPALPEWVRNGNRDEAAHVLAGLRDGTPLSPSLAEVIVPTRIAHAASAA